MIFRTTLVLILCMAANAAELPDSPSKTVDKRFLTVLSAEAVAKSVDFLETAAHLGKETWVPCVPAYTCVNHAILYTVQESDTWFGKDPGTGRMAGENIGLFAAESLIAYEIKKPHRWLPGDRVLRKFWWIPIAYQIQAHARLAYHNSQM
jgi:hypothetical protein